MNIKPMEEQCSSSFYIPVSDGEKLAIDVWLPGNAKGKHLPVIVEFTRYWRLRNDIKSKEVVDAFCDRGFAYACVDVRGTGASTGTRRAEIGVEEVADFSTVMEWLAGQSWSNGAVITHGISYVGNTAEIATVDAPDCLKATVPQFTDFDLYAMLLFPGGLANIGFLEPWSNGVYSMDLDITSASCPSWGEFAGVSVKAVGDLKGLQAAVKDHQRNVPVAEQLSHVVYRDDFEAQTLNLKTNSPDNWISPYQLLGNQRWQSIPALHWGSFADAGTAAGVIARFMASNAPMCGIIGYWSHGLNHDANPFHAPSEHVEPNLDNFIQIKADFLSPLKHPKKPLDDHASIKVERMLYYFTAGEDRWNKTSTWPPVGTDMQRWYLAEGHQLTLTVPVKHSSSSKYAVNFEAGTGSNGRWLQMGAVDYGDRKKADQKLLTYTSSPIQESIEITGHPLVELLLSCSTSDGAVIVYLEAVAPNGRVIVLTEGNLRLRHRKVSHEAPPYPQFGPYHSYKKADQQPMVANVIESIKITLLPMSVTLPAGYSIRVAIAGHDQDSFNRVPENGRPVYNIYHQENYLSHIDIPIVDGGKKRKENDIQGLNALDFVRCRGAS